MGYYLAKVRSLVTDEDTGKAKKKTQTFMFDATTYTEVESLIYDKLKDIVNGELTITNISPVKILETIHGDGFWYFLKVAYVDVDEDSGKEKKVKQMYAVEALDIDKASEMLHEHLKTMVIPFEIVNNGKKDIEKVFEFTPVVLASKEHDKYEGEEVFSEADFDIVEESENEN